MTAFIEPSPVSRSILAGFALFSTNGMHYVGGSSERAPSSPRRRSSGPYAPSVTSPVLPIHEDQRIVAAMARGDERAAAQFYDKYSAQMFALAVRIVGEGADAEDVVLDAFTQAWNKASTYETERGSVLGWLTTMTRTRALDCVRSRGRRSKAVDTASRTMGDDPVGVAGAAVSASDHVELGERAEAVHHAMLCYPGNNVTRLNLPFSKASRTPKLQHVWANRWALSKHESVWECRSCAMYCAICLRSWSHE